MRLGRYAATWYDKLRADGSAGTGYEHGLCRDLFSHMRIVQFDIGRDNRSLIDTSRI